MLFILFWDAKTGPKVLFGGPKARILRAFRSDPRLPRRIAKTIVFYGENRTLVGRRKSVLPPFHCEKATNVSAKIDPSGGFPPFAYDTEGPESTVKYVFSSKDERSLENLVKYVSFRHRNAVITGSDTTQRG